jgi:hypothetical protein
VTDRLIRLTTALAVVAVASVAAIISYQHACELVRTHGESGLTARLLPFTVDGLVGLAGYKYATFSTVVGRRGGNREGCRSLPGHDFDYPLRQQPLAVPRRRDR